MNSVGRMLLIAERFPPDLGGVACSGARTVRALARLGVEVHVLAWTKTLEPGMLQSTPANQPDAASDRVTVHRLGLFSNWDFSMQHTLNVLEWLHARHAFDAVWGHYVYPAGYIAVLFARSSGIAATVSARGNDIDRLMFPPGDFARLIWTLERADVVTAVSHDLAGKIELLLSRPRRFIMEPPCLSDRNSPNIPPTIVELVETKAASALVVPNVVDLDVFRWAEADVSLRESLGIAADESVLGFCGELRHKKGLPFLLRALCEVRRVRPACLLVIGEIRPRENAHLSTFAIEHPEDAARIIVTHQIDEPQQVARHLNLCDVFLQPSVWDGLPNALLEAMACQRTVIASDAGGIPEALEHGVNGFVIPKALLNNLGAAVLESLDWPAEKRASIGKAARETIATKFQPRQEAAVLRTVLDRLVVYSSRGLE